MARPCAEEGAAWFPVTDSERFTWSLVLCGHHMGLVQDALASFVGLSREQIDDRFVGVEAVDHGEVEQPCHGGVADRDAED